MRTAKQAVAAVPFDTEAYRDRAALDRLIAGRARTGWPGATSAVAGR